MTPIAFAKAECANWDAIGQCLNMVFDKAGNQPSGHAREHCLLKSKQRCDYFERYVLPIVDTVSDPLRHKALQKVTRTYAGWGTDNQREATEYIREKLSDGGECPDCGETKAKGHSRCPVCAMQRRRKMARERKHRQRLVI